MTPTGATKTTESMTPAQFSALLEEFCHIPTRDELLRCESVLSVTAHDGAILDLGPGRPEGYLPAGEVIPEAVPFPVCVSVVEDDEGRMVVSAKRGAQRYPWECAKQALASREILPLTITDTTSGGLIGELFGLRAFLPSRLIDRARTDRPEEYVGRTVEVCVAEVDAGARKNLVVSRRDALAIQAAAYKRAKRRAERIATIEVGQVIEVTVTAVKSFGAFAALGAGVEGLIPRSELSWLRFGEPSEVVSEGDRLTVEVIARQDGGKGKKPRITLSVKAAQGDPWIAAGLELRPGASVTLDVDGVSEHGAHVVVSDRPAIRGLIPTAHLAGHKPTGGEQLAARVLSISAQRRRISFTLGKR